MSDQAVLSCPAVTRMLLSSDGSTTRLLEALLGVDLHLDLIGQRRTSAVGLPPHVRHALGCAKTERVLVRRSALRTGGGAVVSMNHVVARCRYEELTPIFADDRVPIGPGLRAAEVVLGRRLLATGLTSWALGDLTDDGGIPCVFKEYVLVDPAGNAVAHLHERFNPGYVPNEGDA